MPAMMLMNRRVLYTGMTRAMNGLVMTADRESEFATGVGEICGVSAV